MNLSQFYQLPTLREMSLRYPFYCHPSPSQSYKVLSPKLCVRQSPIHPARYTSRFILQITTFLICNTLAKLYPQYLHFSINYTPVVLFFLSSVLVLLMRGLLFCTDYKLWLFMPPRRKKGVFRNVLFTTSSLCARTDESH